MLMPSIFGENLFDDDLIASDLVTRLKRDFSVRRIRCMESMQRTL